MAETKESAVEMIEIPRSLAEQTLQLLMNTQLGQTYFLVKAWDNAVPGLIKPAQS